MRKKGKKAFFLLIALLLLLCFGLSYAAEKDEEEEPDWFFQESFDDKQLSNNKVVTKKGETIWQINTAKDQKNTITDNGALELGHAQYMQRAVLNEKLWENKQDYGMEFTINVQRMGNEGHPGRPIAIIIPRSKDTNFKEYYALSYYLENTGYNQFKCKWAIINTAAPTKMSALVEGYFLLRENIDYTGRLVIQNTEDENVHIEFYIDGPTNPAKAYEPLVAYTDSSPYKILESKTGPALGTVGYADDGWGTSPVVRYDNIKLYDIEAYKKYAAQLKNNMAFNPWDINENEKFGEIKYLINRGIIGGFGDNTFRPDKNVTVAEFLKMLITLKGEECPSGKDYWAEHYLSRGIELGLVEEMDYADLEQPLTKYDAALMIFRFNKTPSFDRSLDSLIKDSSTIKDRTLLNAALYSFEKGYLRLDDTLCFKGNTHIDRSEVVNILMRMIDDGYRKANYDLALPNILSSGGVLQGNKKIPVWGKGFTGDTIKVKFKSQNKTTVVKNGQWYLELDPEPYGGPYTLTVTDRKDKITLLDMHVGEVFVVAGQSNAEMFLHECYGAQETKEFFLKNNNLRLYESEKAIAVKPRDTIDGEWQPSLGWVIDGSPAIGTFFAEKLLELNKELSDVKIGIISMTYGGTTIEVFMPDIIMEEDGFVQKDDEPILSGFWKGYMDTNAPYGVKGVIYYQGENSTHLGYGYEPLLRDYIRGFRKEFKDLDLPFMLVQISGFGYNNYEDDSDNWPFLRAVQMKVANTTDSTGLVTTIDLADPDPIEIHPREKKEIGKRLAYLAMGMIYQEDMKQRSPEMKDYRFEGNKVIVGFDYTYGALYIKDDIPKGFEIMDNQGKWHSAQSRINPLNNTVEIWCDEISEPMGAKYAWHNYPEYSLYNQVGYPAFPFRVVNTPDNTNEKILKLPNHMLNNNDAIVNVTRNNTFRIINRMDPDTLSHEYAIGKQVAGDAIETFFRVGNSFTQGGTTETMVKIANHNLSVGDWIRNNTRGWTASRVNEVLDQDTFVITKISGQTVGDDITKYRLKDKAVAR